jgi:hypothetical protein
MYYYRLQINWVFLKKKDTIIEQWITRNAGILSSGLASSGLSSSAQLHIVS